MNHFEFYEIPVSFNPDAGLVKFKFYELSKKYHPDYYINYSPEKQEEVLELSRLNNKAYQVLSDFHKRLHYILELKGLLPEGENYTLPQDFLMEMMEVNELLMDLKNDTDLARLESLKKEVTFIKDGIQKELDKLTATFEALNEERQDVVLVAVKDLYYRKKYLRRIEDSLFRVESGM